MEATFIVVCTFVRRGGHFFLLWSSKHYSNYYTNTVKHCSKFLYCNQFFCLLINNLVKKSAKHSASLQTVGPLTGNFDDTVLWPLSSRNQTKVLTFSGNKIHVCFFKITGHFNVLTNSFNTPGTSAFIVAKHDQEHEYVTSVDLSSEAQLRGCCKSNIPHSLHCNISVS